MAGWLPSNLVDSAAKMLHQNGCKVLGFCGNATSSRHANRNTVNLEIMCAYQGQACLWDLFLVNMRY
jgi:hypothetical protein